MKNEFKVTIWQQILSLSTAIFLYITLFSAFLFFVGFHKGNFIFLYFFLFFFIFDLLPTLIIHYQFFKKNKNSLLIIDTERKTISYRSDYISAENNFSEICEFEYYSSYGFKGARGWYSFGEYRYFKIRFINKEEFIITSLMVNNIENILPMLLQRKPINKLQVIAFIK